VSTAYKRDYPSSSAPWDDLDYTVLKTTLPMIINCSLQADFMAATRSVPAFHPTQKAN
jgi:hypothetical protein